MASLTGMTTLGIVESEESTKDAQLFQMPMPLSDSTNAIMLDLFGASRTIRISGVFVDGTSGLSVAQFIQQLDNLVNGKQTPKVYVSDKSGASYNVLIQNVNWNAEEGAPTKINYSIEMIEGSL